MITPVSCAAARRILGCAVVESVRIMRNGAVQVTYRQTEQSSRCSTFISRLKFEQDFIEFRKAGAKSITSVTPWVGENNRFSVRSATSPDQAPYTVTIEGDHHTCTCPDWVKQREARSQNPICKHGFAVRNYLSAPISAQVGMRQVAKPKPKLLKRMLYCRLSDQIIHVFIQTGNANPEFYKSIHESELEWAIQTACSRGWSVVDATPVVNAGNSRTPTTLINQRDPVQVG